MKTLIQLFKATSVFAFFTFSIFAQGSGLSIELADEPGVAKNGQTIYASSTTDGNIIVNMYIKNPTGTDMQVKWERVVLSVSNENLSDQLCDDDFCYPTGQLGPNWVLNAPTTIAANGQVSFKPELIVSASGGSAEFMYYIRNAADQRIDSVKIVFNSTASLSNEPTVSAAKVYPNPSTGQVNVKNAPTGSTIEFTDMLGKVVLKKSLNGTVQSFNISSQPDGVYFYTIKSANGSSTSTKRLVLRK